MNAKSSEIGLGIGRLEQAGSKLVQKSGEKTS